MNKRLAIKFLLVFLSVFLLAGICWRVYDKSEKQSGSPFFKNKKSVKNFSTGPEESKKEKIEITFAGDMMLDRYIRTVAEKKGNDFIFQDIKSFLIGSDLAVANLEGPITDNSSVSQTSEFGSRENYFFTFDPSWTKTLKEHNIGLLCIGNNHILNFGQDGLEQTKKYIKDAGLDYFGYVRRGDESWWIKNIGDWKVGFVSYNQFASGSYEKALEDIEKIKGEADVVFVYCHWGREYEKNVDDGQREKARRFIDTGADLVVGSHSHVVGEKEIYENKKIYYSLGNFVFDQYFREDTQKGLLLKITIQKDLLDVEEFDIIMDNNGGVLMSK